uniref:Small ribosomal subunit protein uS9c n=1 Tax=Tydemania expeditionis TaxID=325645 RepID=A0A0D6E247_TYDEX|nr:ribosomal protein S9 [Tydemania expeditionis]CEO91060.1 ribosomal protein S9 [Tydemania expeditionis]
MYKNIYYGIGRRKSAIAKVFLMKNNLKYNKIIVNKKTLSEYFQSDKDGITNLEQFLQILGISITAKINVSGGGMTGQKEAIRLGLARALAQQGFGSILKNKKFLTQDSRVKERKKYGLKKARKAPQYSKR